MKITSLLMVSSLLATATAEGCGDPVLSSCLFFTNSACTAVDNFSPVADYNNWRATINQLYWVHPNSCVKNLESDLYSMVTCPHGKV